MSTVLEYPDMELWLSGYLRAGLAAWSPTVDRRFPETGTTYTNWVVVRDDSGSDAQFTASRLVAVTIIGPDGAQSATERLAQRAAALIRASAIPGPTTPVVNVRTVRGPWALTSGARPQFYLTAELSIVGIPITI